MEATFHVPESLFTVLSRNKTEDLSVVFGLAKASVRATSDTSLAENTKAQISTNHDQRIDFHIVITKTGIPWR
jgi:hypothetical protein